MSYFVARLRQIYCFLFNNIQSVLRFDTVFRHIIAFMAYLVSTGLIVLFCVYFRLDIAI